MITELKYNQVKEESIQQLSKVFPNINVSNLIRAIWVGDIPFFYIEKSEVM